MVFYFSATGNSKYVASRIADFTQDRLVSISDCLKRQEFSFDLKEGESVGLVSPVYFGGLPAVVEDFLDKLKLKFNNPTYVYFVATCGAVSGGAYTFFQRHIKKLGLELSAGFSVKMPDNWTVIFSVNNKKRIDKILKKADKHIEAILPKIKNHVRGFYARLPIPMFVINIWRKAYEKSRKTQNFVVLDSCVGCGLCAQKCPEEAIQIQDNRPVWIKEKCSICLGCLHRCPNFAIQYGEKTKYHGQYLHPCLKND